MWIISVPEKQIWPGLSFDVRVRGTLSLDIGLTYKTVLKEIDIVIVTYLFLFGEYILNSTLA